MNSSIIIEVYRQSLNLPKYSPIFVFMRWITILFFGGIMANLSAQNVEKITLEKCIQLAFTKNYDVQLAAISESIATIDYQQSKYNLSPEISGSAGQYFQSGRSIDRFTNQYVQTTIGSNNFQLQANWTLFAGGQLRNNIQKLRFDKQASHLDLEQVKQNIALSVALAYLQCLQTKEQVEAAKSIATNGKLELDRLQKLLTAGATNEGAIWSAKAQYLNQISNLTQAENAKKSAYLNLKNLIQLDPKSEFELEVAAFDVPQKNKYPIDIQSLIDSATARRPEVAAAKARQESAIFTSKIAKGALLPTLSLGGNLNSVYSGNAKTITGFSIVGSQPIGYVKSNLEIVETPKLEYTTQTIEFGKQIKDNFGQSFGATLSIPIYGKLQTQTQINKANIGIIQSQIALEKSYMAVRNDVSNAYISFENSADKYFALKETYEAQRKNTEFVKIRFANAQASQFEIQTAENAENSAYQNLISAKYEFVFRKLVLDYFYNNQLSSLSN